MLLLAVISAIQSDLAERKNRLTDAINRRNPSYFEQKMQKARCMSDDLKVGLEQEIKEVDQIK